MRGGYMRFNLFLGFVMAMVLLESAGWVPHLLAFTLICLASLALFISYDRERRHYLQASAVEEPDESPIFAGIPIVQDAQIPPGCVAMVSGGRVMVYRLDLEKEEAALVSSLPIEEPSA